MGEKLTSADVIAINSSEEATGLILECEKRIPELAFFHAVPVDKIQFDTVARTTLPTAGFRDINTGRTRDHGTLEKRAVECKFLDASWDADDAALAGVDPGGPVPDPVRELQVAHLLAAFKALQRQIYEGVAADADGFVGLQGLFPYSDSEGVVDAAGTAPSAATSIYLVKTGDPDVSLCWRGGKLTLGKLFDVQLTDELGKPYMGTAQKIHGWCGLRMLNHLAVMRIANITTEVGHGATDELVAQAILEFISRYGDKPDGIMMNHRSATQIRDGRTATNASGDPAPVPEDVLDVPVIITRGLTNTETILTPA